MTDQTETSLATPALPDLCCGRCTFFFLVGPGQPSYCRRFPPTPFLIHVEKAPDSQLIVGSQQISMNPTVNQLGYCGEFKRAQGETQ